MRLEVYDILNDFLNRKVYINLRLKKLNKEQKEINQITIRVYGYLQNKEYLSFLVREMTEKKKLDAKTELILSLAIYEKLYLDSIPDYAIINEYQNLSSKVYQKGKKYIAYVLNNNLKDIVHVKPNFTDQEKNVSITYSHPKWIVKTFIEQYPSDYIDILKSANSQKEMTARVVKPLIETDKYMKYMFDDLVTSNENMINNLDFINNNLIIQDIGSYSVTKLLNLTNNDTLLDLCAAPGSKTLHSAKYCKEVYANEISEKRLKLLADNLIKYDIDNVRLLNNDATQVIEELKDKKFTKVLVDAPCSGLGCLSAKPEIKYYMNKETIKELIQLQREIFDNALNYLTDDGEIVYSTCSINKQENEEQVKYFIDKYDLYEVKEAQLDKIITNKNDLGITILPNVYNSDGFYMCKLKRK